METVAVRMPAHPVFCAVLRAFGRPVAAPSAKHESASGAHCNGDDCAPAHRCIFPVAGVADTAGHKKQQEDNKDREDKYIRDAA